MTPASQPSLDRCVATHDAVHRHYVSLPGKTEESWEQNVAKNPARFNQVWRHLLRLPASDTPPPQSQ